MAESEKQELVFPELEPGMRFGRYELRREVGRGGMGVVWEAKDHTLGETVALKFLPEILAADKSAMKLLKEEALILLSLTHPNIVRVRNLESQARRAFIVEEFLSGETLEELMIARRDEGKSGLTAEEALWALDQIGPGLDYAHTEGITHRDIKPANMMLDRPVGSSLGGDAAKLKMMDFGLAFVATSTITMKTGVHPSGTLPYMAPEVLLGGKPTPLTDIYSLGTTLYTLIAGECPFAHGDIFNLIQTVTPPPLQSGNDSLDEAIAAAMAKDPLDRPASTEQFCALAFGEIELEEALQDLTEDEELTEEAPGRSRRRTAAIAALAVVILTTISFFVPSIRGALFGDEAVGAEGTALVVGPNTPASVPSIHLTSPERDGASTVFTNKDRITIAGRVENALSSEIKLLLGPEKRTWVHSGGEFSKRIHLIAGGPLVVSIEAEGADAPISFEVIYDPVPPEIHLVSPESDFKKVAASPFDFVLDVEEEFIQEVKVGSHSCEQVSPGHFIASGVPLQEGENVFEITATDRAGNTALPLSVTIVRDSVGPELVRVSFASPGAESEELQELTGGEPALVTMSFNERVQTLEFDGAEYGPPGKEISFEVDVPLKEGGWEIPWIAHDELNNRTSGTLTRQIRMKLKVPRDFEVVQLTMGWHGWARKIRDPRTQITFVLIDPGTFLMGSSEWEGRMDETPRHSRKIERGFYLATTEVTIYNWKSFADAYSYRTGPEQTAMSFSRDDEGHCKPIPNAYWRDPVPLHPTINLQTDHHPVTQVTWEDAREFCKHYGYRLPHEDEWEYACRAGRTGLYWWGDVAAWGHGKGNFADEWLAKTFKISDEYPFNDGNTFTAPADYFDPNPWGLHNMLGNVWEWCEDPYRERAYERDGWVDFDKENADLRVIRGGSWRSGTKTGRCARRGIAAMNKGSDILGFRVAMEINEKEED